MIRRDSCDNSFESPSLARSPLTSWRHIRAQECPVEDQGLHAPHMDPLKINVTRLFEKVFITIVNILDLVPSLWQLPWMFDKSWQAPAMFSGCWPFLNAISEQDAWNIWGKCLFLLSLCVYWIVEGARRANIGKAFRLHTWSEERIVVVRRRIVSCF